MPTPPEFGLSSKVKTYLEKSQGNIQCEWLQHTLVSRRSPHPSAQKPYSVQSVELTGHSRPCAEHPLPTLILTKRSEEERHRRKGDIRRPAYSAPLYVRRSPSTSSPDSAGAERPFLSRLRCVPRINPLLLAVPGYHRLSADLELGAGKAGDLDRQWAKCAIGRVFLKSRG